MDKRTKILIGALVLTIIGLVGLVIWQAGERNKWERAFSELNGVVFHEYIMNNPEVIIASVRIYMRDNPVRERPVPAPLPPKELEVVYPAQF